jgi:hypothetical protein
VGRTLTGIWQRAKKNKVLVHDDAAVPDEVIAAAGKKKASSSERSEDGINLEKIVSVEKMVSSFSPPLYT